MLSSITNKIKKIPSYFYRNFVAPKIYSIRDKEILSRNLELKNKYADQRCFIIGAGPSIANTNLALLNQEYTFVVNEFEKNSQYKSLSPKFHVISESNYYTEGGPEYWTNRLKEKNNSISRETAIIINLRAKPFIEKNNLFQKHKIYFVGTQGIFNDNLPFNIDLDKYVPQPKNSMLMCLLIANWLGFKEIYLLGCEHSFLAQPLGPMKSLGWAHSYESEAAQIASTDAETLKKYITPKEMSFNYEMSMASVLQLFRSYRLFYAKVQKINPNLKIFNATPNSFLDIFPMINFNDIKLSH